MIILIAVIAIKYYFHALNDVEMFDSSELFDDTRATKYHWMKLTIWLK
jgi:hypothetical protein